MDQEVAVKKIYEDLIKAWNNRDAEKMGNLFTQSGENIGFDGSLSKGREEIISHLQPIFRDHPTAPFVHKVKEVKFIGDQTAILRAIAGMIPPGESDIKPDVNTHHTLVLAHKEDKWEIELFQNTPAQFHGRPELMDQMTRELRERIR